MSTNTKNQVEVSISLVCAVKRKLGLEFRVAFYPIHAYFHMTHAALCIILVMIQLIQGDL